MATYAGESVAKKVARIRTYRRISEAWDIHGGIDRNKAKAIVLAGPEALEVGALKYILRLKPENVLFVDIDPTGLTVAEKKWPGVRTSFSPIQTALEREFNKGHKFHFIHLDLMGNLTDSFFRNMSSLGDYVANGACIALTFLRARESRNDWRGVLGIAKHVCCEDRNCPGIQERISLDPDRIGGYWLTLASQITTTREINNAHRHLPLDLTAQLIASYKYNSTISPMGVVLVQAVRRVKVTSPSYKRFRNTAGSVLSASTINRHAILDLLKEVDVLSRLKLPSEQIAEIVGVPVGTIAAWKAHRTMGTYV